jgi:hypothetical protein
MSDPFGAARRIAEGALGHEVPTGLPPEGDGPIVAASMAGDPPRARVAWVAADGAVLARVACPPGRPSRARPVVATVVDLATPEGVEDRLVVARAAPEAVAVRPVLATEEQQKAVPVGEGGLAIARIGAAPVLAVDALDARGEPIGRLIRAGIAELHSDGGAVSGRLGAGHGMSAGFGAGRWCETLEEAAFEAGFTPRLPGWLPDGLERTRPRMEPDPIYPAAPPGIVIAWTSADGRSRVLLRQVIAPLATPPLPSGITHEVPIGDSVGVVGGRRLGTLVWETPDRAFGLQVRGLTGPDDVAVRVARTIPAA